MRLSFHQFLLCAILYGASYAHETSGQAVLEKRVSLDVQGVRFKKVLSMLGEQADVRFVYSSNSIDSQRQVTLKAFNQRLDLVLKELLNPYSIEFTVSDSKMISLTPVLRAKESSIAVPELREEMLAREVNGRVVDEKGGALPGVSILLKGTQQGLITDVDGRFTVEIPDENAVLAFSFVGYLSQEIVVGNKSNLEIEMQVDQKSLEEVVVVGYGEVSKRDLTGSVSVIQSDALSRRNEVTVSQALQGTMSGVMVTRSGNSPGSGATIRIRGVTTIGDSNPLIIRDGVPISNINAINPNDIESITVLKDGASASIYGARAASGVILITTKRAKSGALDLSYNFEYGIEKPTELADYVKPIRYMQMFNEWGWNDNNNTGSEYPTYTKDLISNYYSLNEQNSNLYPVTDWVDLILKKSAPRQSHSFAYSAGTSKFHSKGSIAYDNVGGLYMKRNWDRVTVNVNNDVAINKYFKMTLDLNARHARDKNPVFNPMFHTRITPAIYAATWSDGRVAQAKSGDNIYGVLKEGGFNNTSNSMIWGKFALDFSPFDGLKLSAIASGELNLSKGKKFQILSPYYAWDDPTRLLGYLHMGSQHQGSQSTSLTEIRDEGRQITTQFFANYAKKIQNHNINVTVGNENFQLFSESLGASRDQYTLTSFPYLNLGPLNFRSNSGSAFENAYRSFFGRLLYNFGDKYLIQGNVRFDASSRLHPDFRWGYFPSISAGWIVTEEKFLPPNDILSFLKLRVSWGLLGNERIGNYPYHATIAFGNALFYSGNSVVSAQTSSQDRYAIRDISWETTESNNLGVDASLFNSRLQITGDFYKKTTKDMLLALEIPDYIGLNNPDQNTGKMHTRGWDLEVAWRDHLANFRYSISGNLSDFRSVMGDLGGTEFLGSKIRIKGSEFDEWYGFRSDGLYQTNDEVNSSAKLSANVKPGDIKYKDVSGPNGIPDGRISPEYDRVPLGGSLPRYMYGGNVQIGYKDFDFSIVVQGVGKQNVIYEQLMVQPFVERWGNVPAIIDGNYWSLYNSNEQNQSARFPRLSSIGESNNYAPMSDFWMFNGAYLRLKNVTLGYSVPKKLTERLKCNNIYLYMSMSDILSINRYPKGWDPELSATGYPITTSLLFGLSIKF